MEINQPQKILVVAPSWIGDMVMAQSLLKKIKIEYPTAQIYVFVPEWCKALLKRMPEVTDVVVNPFKHKQLKIIDRIRVGRSLRQYNFDWCIVLPNSIKSVLVPWFAKIPVRRGWKGEQRYLFLNQMFKHKELLPLMVQRYDALVYSPNDIEIKNSSDIGEIPEPKLTTCPNNINVILAKFGIEEKTSVMGICPGAEYGVAKRWLPEYYAQVASVWIKQKGAVYIFGGPKDTPIAEEILNFIPQELKPHCYLLTGKTELTEAIDLLSNCSIVVTNDSGLMHVSAAVGTPLVAIYGSSSTGYTPPLTSKAKTVFLNDLPCRPCFKRICPHNTMECLVNLRPVQIIKEINDLIKSNLTME